MKVALVPPDLIPRIWTRVEQLIRPAIEVPNATATPADVLHFLCVGQMHLWIAFEGEELRAAAVAEIFDRRSARVCAVHYLGGERMDEWWTDMETAVETWAKGAGCTVFDALVRRGIARNLRGRFAEVGTVIRRAI